MKQKQYCNKFNKDFKKNLKKKVRLFMLNSCGNIHIDSTHYGGLWHKTSWWEHFKCLSVMKDNEKLKNYSSLKQTKET